MADDAMLEGPPWAGAAAPPAFGDVVVALRRERPGLDLAAMVRADVLACGARFLLVPTVGRYAGLVDPDAAPAAADEVVHHVLTAAGAEFRGAADALGARFPAWAVRLDRAAVARELLGGDEDAAPLPAEVGPAWGDGGARFQIGPTIARGAYGVVALANDRSVAAGESGDAPDDALHEDRGDAVVKFVRATAADPEPWRTEAGRAALVEHRCGVRVLDAGELPGRAGEGYIAMERVLGRSLAAMAAAGERLPIDTVAREAVDLALAIDELHAQGYAHGDLGPANVLVDRAGRLRLVDYGLSQPITPELARADGVRLAQLVQWMVLGWVPPAGGGVPVALGMRGALVRAAARQRAAPAGPGGFADALIAARGGAWRTQVVTWILVAAVILWLAPKIRIPQW
jgi:hypothetical protein